jgi:hypothetical protein
MAPAASLWKLGPEGAIGSDGRAANWCPVTGSRRWTRLVRAIGSPARCSRWLRDDFWPAIRAPTRPQLYPHGMEPPALPRLPKFSFAGDTRLIEVQNLRGG